MVTAGETTIDDPVPSSVPPHEPLYQVHTAPVPNDPPETLRVAFPPWQIVGELAVADVGAAELAFTVTVTLAQVVVLHVPSALT